MHLDLVRNDWEKQQQLPVARVFVDPEMYGAQVKDELGRWEGNVFDALGPLVRGSADEIAARLREAFDGPYVIATALHSEEDCPFKDGVSLPIEEQPVPEPFVLPVPPGS